MKKICMNLWLPLATVLTFVVAFLFTPFETMDHLLADTVSRDLSGVESAIKIIAVDEETLNAYGDFSAWSREKSAQLIELLCADEDKKPCVVGMDFLFVDERDEEADNALYEACKEAGNVVFASNLVYRGTTKTDGDGERYFDSWNVEFVEQPFLRLQTVSDSGFANVNMATDGCVRYTKIEERVGENLYPSFAFTIYKYYQNAGNKAIVLPKTDNQGKFTFFYSGEVGEFPHFSLCDVLEGKVPTREFKDCIVLVGAYSAGMQDAYISTVDRATPMHGVEIHANIIQALMQGKTAVPVPDEIYLVVAVAVLFLFAFAANKQKLPWVIVESALLVVVHLVLGSVLAKSGYTFRQLYFVGVILLLLVYFVIEKYFGERLRRKKVLSVFKKYVAPQIVDKLAKSGEFELKLGGEKRDIAVLFVDIRGFTPMSENLLPEQVVQILNEYLALTTASILSNEGTLDKFIGDATMAVFNAPFDLEDYEYRAIKAALAIRDGSEKLAEELQKKFGRTISYGIGVNCGDAVVGNIGCEFRMDYTAIGDTVNTAARLESRAKAGEILISEALFERVKERIEAEQVGEMELKGKAKAVNVYRLIDVRENS